MTFYSDNANRFFADTVNTDMSAQYSEFLPLVPQGGAVLDAGCGSGRDSKHFLELGYQVTPMDASMTLCGLAANYLHYPVTCLRFENIDWHESFDAIWACASLLHVTRSDLPNVIQRLIRSLKAGGVMYCSFKWGEKEHQKDGRHFTNMTDASFTDLVSKLPGAGILKIWKSGDNRPGRASEQWLNA